LLENTSWGKYQKLNYSSPFRKRNAQETSFPTTTQLWRKKHSPNQLSPMSMSQSPASSENVNKPLFEMILFKFIAISTPILKHLICKAMLLHNENRHGKFLYITIY
jgi:hypothetical protein